MLTTLTQNSKLVTLVLVEDDDGDAKAIQRAFKKTHIQNPIKRAIDGVDALGLLQGDANHQPLPRPFILLVDINMPRMNGLDFVRALRNDPELDTSIVFILTTSKRDEDKLAAYQLNVAGYIVKETAGRDFIRLIELMDCYWRIIDLP